MGSKKKTILVFGIGQSNFLKQLYSALHKVSGREFDFDIFGLKELSGKDEYGVEVFRNQLANRQDLQPRDLINLFEFKFWILFVKLIAYGMAPSQVSHFIRSYLISKTLYKQYKGNRYDMLHFHFPTFTKSGLFWQIDKKTPLVVSFWGSDLMRFNGLLEYYVQSKILDRADIITTHGEELKQQILSKFGRHLEGKIHFTRFAPYDRLFDLMDELNSCTESARESLSGYGIPKGKKLVVIGNNGSPQNNHLEILSLLKNIPSEVKQNCFIVLPFSYSPNEIENYDAKCEKGLADIGMEGILLKEFLPWEDLAALRLCTAIMVYMPISDALSGTLTESLYGGSAVIAGDWLPYSPFVKDGLKFDQISKNELPTSFLRAYQNQKSWEELLRDRKIIREKFLSDYCAQTWLPIYKLPNASEKS